MKGVIKIMNKMLFSFKLLLILAPVKKNPPSHEASEGKSKKNRYEEN
jgi:hypothetical protein